MTGKTCKCGESYHQYTTLQNKCPRCLADAARKKRLTQEKKAKKEDRQDIRKRKEALKTKPQLEKAAQLEFNKFIRFRDRDEVCRSCGRTNAEVEPTDGWKPGGAWDCGHYLSVGSHPELRFEEKNAYKQCKSCNGGSGKYARKSHTVAMEYRARLIEYRGLELVEWLEGPHEAKNYIHDELREIKAKYRKKWRELERQQNEY